MLVLFKPSPETLFSYTLIWLTTLTKHPLYAIVLYSALDMQWCAGYTCCFHSKSWESKAILVPPQLEHFSLPLAICLLSPCPAVTNSLGYFQAKPGLDHHTSAQLTGPTRLPITLDCRVGFLILSYKAPIALPWKTQWAHFTVFPIPLPPFSSWELPSAICPFHPDTLLLDLHYLTYRITSLCAECSSHWGTTLLKATHSMPKASLDQVR